MTKFRFATRLLGSFWPFQLHEERYRLKLLDAERGAGKAAGLDVDEASIFLGTSKGAHGSACVSPVLLEHVANTLKEEAAIMKERRKAQEEHLAMKKQKPGE